MANFCPSCGCSVSPDAAFCSACGTALNPQSTQNAQTTSQSFESPDSGGILGTLVAVSLLGGLTRQLYYYGGRYFLDPYCRRPFLHPHMIIGRPRPMHGPGRPMSGPHGPMGGPRGGRGPAGGPGRQGPGGGRGPGGRR